MKKIKRGFICTIFVLLLFTSVSGKAFDGLEGVVILNPDDDGSSKSDVDTNQEGLVLSVEGCNIECIDEVYSNIVLHTTLMNWDTEEYQIGDVISARLYYQETYEYDAAIDFAGETRIGMLVNLDGTITFTVPNIVAMADEDELRLEMTVLDENYDEKINFEMAAEQALEEIRLPFSYDMRNSDDLELSLGSAYIIDKWNGEIDEKYKWVVQEISLINWSQSTKNLKDSLHSMLTYMHTYGFEAQVILPQEQLRTLEVIQGKLVYHIPVIVSTAEKDTLTLEIMLLDDTWSESFDINNIELKDYRERQNKVEDPTKVGYWGLSYVGLSEETRQLYNLPIGVWVEEVLEGGAADRAGIQKGDVISEIDGKKVNDDSDFSDIVQYYEAGEEIEIIVAKSEDHYQEKTITVILDTRPSVEE